jgi:SPP1 family predicted phage head-tail adaptor
VTAFPIGDARQRVVLESKVLTADGGGGYAENWEAYALVWAALEIEGGGKPMEAGRPEMRVSCRIIIRRRSDVSVNHRVRLAARVFAIRAIVDPGAQSASMTLLCEEGAPS